MNTQTTSSSFWLDALETLLRIPSVTGREHAAGDYLATLLRTTFPNAEVDLIPAADGRFNVRAIAGAPRVTLTSHFDTVPGDLTVKVEEGRIHGRGACDAKGQIIAQLWGLSLAIERGLSDYCVHFVVGEETDGIGARTLVAHNPPTPFLLNGEPTNNRFVSRCWGAVDLQICATGVAQHSSLGTAESAVHSLIRDLNRLLLLNAPHFDINVGTVTGGVASNVQAPTASALLCVRIAHDTEQVLHTISSALQESVLEVMSEPLHPLSLFVAPVGANDSLEVRFSSDCSIYHGHFEKVMLFGPGDIALAHTDHESIATDELDLAAHNIAELLRWIESADA